MVSYFLLDEGTELGSSDGSFGGYNEGTVMGSSDGALKGTRDGILEGSALGTFTWIYRW